MIGKYIFALMAMSCTTANCVIYTRSILHGKIKPHGFSWLIWALLMLIGAAAQWSSGAGPGTFPTAYAGLFCTSIAVLSIFFGEKDITKSDWIVFIAALSAIPVWMTTHDALAAVIIVTCVDAAGFYPTFRKSYARPWQENIVTFTIGGTVALLTLLALETYSLTTLLYPLSLVITHFALVAVIVWRRRAVKA